jgi:hypothetical protein
MELRAVRLTVYNLAVQSWSPVIHISAARKGHAWQRPVKRKSKTGGTKVDYKTKRNPGQVSYDRSPYTTCT